MNQHPQASRSRRPLVLALVALGLAVLLLILAAEAAPSMTRKLFGLWRVRAVLAPLALLIVAGGLLAAYRSRDTLFGYVAVCLGMGVTVAALEAAGLVGIVSWQSLLAPQSKVAAIGIERKPHLDVSGRTAHDLTSSWGMPTQFVEYRYRTDRHGFRNDIDREAADVYLVGDSIVVGALVPFESTVAGQLERRIGLPVMQVALIGKGPQEEHQLLRDAKLDVNQRLVLQFVFEGNDLLDSRRYRTRAEKPTVDAYSSRSFIEAIVLTLQRWTQPVHGASVLRTCDIGSERFAFGWVRNSFAGVEDEMPQVASSLKAFADEVRRSGGRYGVVYVPSKLRVLGSQCVFPPGSELTDYRAHLSPLRDYLRRWSQSEQVSMLDLTEALAAAAQAGNVPWLSGDTHWNELGHRIAAEAVAAWAPVQAVANERRASGQATASGAETSTR